MQNFEIFIVLIFYKFKKLSLVSFYSKELSTKCFKRKSLQSIKPLCCWGFIPKIRKFHALVFFIKWYLKELILGSFEPLFAQKLQRKFFPKNIIYASFKPLCCCNFMQKLRNVLFIHFWLKLRNLILPLVLLISI